MFRSASPEEMAHFAPTEETNGSPTTSSLAGGSFHHYTLTFSKGATLSRIAASPEAARHIGLGYRLLGEVVSVTTEPEQLPLF